jgi:hypothetical protein
MYQAVPAKPKRPAVVTIAAVILGLLALLSLASAIAAVISTGQTEDQFRRLALREDLSIDQVDAAVGALRAGLICTGLIMVAFALLLGGLAWGVLGGSRSARVVTWVVCGLGVLCACCTGSGSVTTFSDLETAGQTGADEVTGTLMVNALPDWVAGVLLGSSGLMLLGYIATAILLALPAANAFFRGARPAGAWQPPTYPQNPPNYPPPPAHPSHPAPPNP